VLAVVAVPFEARGLARRLAGRGAAAAAPALVVRAVGLGSVGLSRAAPGLAALRPRAVLATGLAGGCAPGVRPGEILVGSRVGPTAAGAWVTPDAALVERVLGALGARRLPHRVGPLVTVREVAATPEAKAVLWRDHQAIGVDMESAHVLAWAGTAGFPAAAVRAVSDGPVEDVPPALLRALSPDGRARWGAVLGWVTRPAAAGAAWRLWRQGRTGLDRLAEALLALAASWR
jgi:nucleoside phosphorylase